MTQAVEDNATVKIFYEPRLAKVWLDEDKLKEVDKYYSELEADGTSKEALKKSQSTMSRMEVLVGDEDRLNLLANDILNHYNERKSILNSKAMIVCMTRRTAYDLYNQIIEVQPDIKEKVAVIVTESNKDTKEQRDIFKDKSYREWARNEFKKKNSKIKLVIVVNMLLTGYDVEDLDVMYIDKPMKSHNLMQAIARVNRVYKGKENGLVVDYIGLRKELNNALNYYTKRDKEMNIQNIQDSAKMLLKEKLSVLNEMFYKINYKNYLSSDNLKRFQAIQNGADFIFASKKRQKDFMKLAKDLKNAYIVSMTCLEDELKNKTLYYISIRHFTMKLLRSSNPVSVAEINNRVAELISESIKGDETELLIPVSTDDSNIFDLLKDDIIEKLRNSKPPHIFIKIMEKLLKEAVSEYKQYNLIKAKKYSERLKDLLDRYLSREDNDVIDNTIDELVGFSKEMVEDENEAKTNKISGRERAFYDALIVENDVEKLKNDGMLRVIAFELKKITEKFAVVDWSKKRSTQAKMRMAIRKLLKKHNYPPNYTDSAIDRILNQAEYMM
jgi:type I restriction enzyme R subunit